jgi:hypothetical protein
MPKWNVTIPDETDRLVRTHLARNGMKKGDLSALVDEAVRGAIIRKMAAELREQHPEAGAAELEKALQGAVRRGALGQIIEDVQERNANADPDELQAEIDEALAWVRRARPA